MGYRISDFGRNRKENGLVEAIRADWRATGNTARAVALLPTLLFGCATTQAPVVEPPKPAAPPKPKDPKEAVEQSLTDRIKRFHPLMLKEFKEEKLRLNVWIRKEGEPGAHYLSGHVSIPCSKGYRECDIDSIDHELGHHVWYGLSDADKKSMTKALEDRMGLDDTKEFWKRIRQYNAIGKEAMPYVEHIMNLGWLRYDARFLAKTVTKYSEWALRHVYDRLKRLDLGKKFHTSINADMKKILAKKYINLAQQKFGEIYRYLNCLEQNMDDLDAGKEATRQCSKPVLPADFAQNIPEITDEVESMRKKLGNALEELVKLAREAEKKGQLTKKELHNIVKAERDYSDKSLSYLTNRLSVAVVLKQTRTKMEKHHDDSIKEQFAATVDSLYSLYMGTIRTKPMRMRLTEPVLSVLERIEYKGVRIFEDQARKYRNALKTYEANKLLKKGS
jgi:hypothetical protein